MGITYDQVADGAVARLALHHEQLMSYGEHVAKQDRLARDMACWAFARTAISSEHIAALIRTVARAFETGEYIEEDMPRDPGDWDAPHPYQGIRVLRMLIEGYAHLQSIATVDQDNGLDAAGDAARMIEQWNPPRGDEAVLYLERAEFDALAKDRIESDCWLGIFLKLDQTVPMAEIDAALAEIRRRDYGGK